jgi:hypothetical protein
MVLPLPGLEYLRLLVERPGVDIPALDLMLAARPATLGPDHPGDRATTTVRRAIRTALARLELHDAEVACELRTTIRTGPTCRYEPDPFRPIAWHVSHAHSTSQA